MSTTTQSAVREISLVSKELLEIPNEFLCPITLEVMREPVIAADGHTYEKTAMERWLAGGHRTSPKTNLPLAHTTLTPNRALRSAIETYTSAMPTIQQAEIQRHQETLNLQAIIKLREEELSTKKSSSEIEKDELVRTIGQLEEALKIREEMVKRAKVEHEEIEKILQLERAKAEKKLQLLETKAREQAEKMLAEERAKIAPLAQKLDKILTAEQEKIAVKQERVKELMSLRESMLQSSTSSSSQSMVTLGTPTTPSLLSLFNRGQTTSVLQPAPSSFQEIITPAQRQAFLNHVIAGEQHEAELMLQDNPVLALLSGTVIDHADRRFKNITGFQYAAWALDWHMWTMIKEYLPPDAARTQAIGFTTGSWVAQHGVHANWQNLIDALQVCLDNYDKWKHDNSLLSNHWTKQVGGAQRVVPMHVIHEYCHPDRSFEPCPSFVETTLPRWSTKPTKLESGKDLSCAASSSSYALLRGAGASVRAVDTWDALSYRCSALAYVLCDRCALVGLLSVRTRQHVELVTQLTQSASPELRP